MAPLAGLGRAERDRAGNSGGAGGGVHGAAPGESPRARYCAGRRGTDCHAGATPADLAIVGVAQWEFLRGKFRGTRWWVPATALGALVAAPVQILIDQGFRALLHHKPTQAEVLAWALVLGIAVGLCIAA